MFNKQLLPYQITGIQALTLHCTTHSTTKLADTLNTCRNAVSFFDFNFGSDEHIDHTVDAGLTLEPTILHHKDDSFKDNNL